MKRGRIISFRVAQEHYEVLAARSGNGGSPGSYARELMLQALHSEYVVEGIKGRLDQHENRLADMQDNLARMLRALVWTKRTV